MVKYEFASLNVSYVSNNTFYSYSYLSHLGGRDVWFVNRDNYKEVIQAIPNNTEYVIQKYVQNPMLFNGKKFHFRCYSVMMADSTALLYEKGFILTCAVDYAINSDDPMSHITNLSVNKNTLNHPGQIPCDLVTEYSDVFRQVSDIWRDVVIEASVYMCQQRSRHHFEFFGLDIIADATGMCWLIEINRLPGLESSKNFHKDSEDVLYDTMMTQLLNIVLKPLHHLDEESESCNSPNWVTVHRPALLGNLEDNRLLKADVISETNGEEANKDKLCFLNILRWKMYTRKVRDEVMV